MDINNLEPGFYILECIEEIGYDECFFSWTKGHKYRMQIDEDGDAIVEADSRIFNPTTPRLVEMMECFIVDKDLYNNKGVVQYFIEKRKSYNPEKG